MVKLNEEKCLKSLAAAGCKMDTEGKVIKVTRPLGLRRLRKADCLRHYHGWRVVWG